MCAGGRERRAEMQYERQRRTTRRRVFGQMAVYASYSARVSLVGEEQVVEEECGGEPVLEKCVKML